jgi:GxxExxY protein
VEPQDHIIREIVGAAFEVSNTLGCGFLEKVYERALRRELGLRGLAVKSQVAFSVVYKGEAIGEDKADLLVANQVIVELKCVDCFLNEHLAQCLNYLKISGMRLALLFNFQRPKLEWKRVIL